jgi:hypothetical protein
MKQGKKNSRTERANRRKGKLKAVRARTRARAEKR